MERDMRKMVQQLGTVSTTIDKDMGAMVELLGTVAETLNSIDTNLTRLLQVCDSAAT
jgi:hypothetical protein